MNENGDVSAVTYKEGYKYEDMSIGMTHQTVHTITEKDIDLFAEVSGDRNPLHMDEEFAKQTQFGQRIAHAELHRRIRQH